MDFTTAVKLFFANYANFHGRATRAMYWWPALFMFVVEVVLMIIGYILDSNGILANVLVGLFGLAMIVPSLSVGVRRMHDIGKGGGWIFISFVPVIGTIWYLVLCLTPSERGDNRFGAYIP